MIELPAVVYEKNCSIGKIRYQLLPSKKVSVTNKTRIPISSRTREPLWSLEDGTRVLVTEKSIVNLPEGVDGVARERNGKLVWKTRQLLEGLQASLIIQASTALLLRSAALPYPPFQHNTA